MSDSPYKILNNWLFDNNNEIKLEKSILNNINLAFILNSFSKCNQLTMFLNKTFNDINSIYKIDKYQFLILLKKLIVNKKINKYKDLSYYKINKINQDVKTISEKLPYLKYYEIEYLLSQIKEDEEYEEIMKYFGLLKEKSSKKKKIPSKIKKELKEELKNYEKSNKKISMKKWKNNFV